MQVREDSSLSPSIPPKISQKSSQDSVIQRTWKTALQRKDSELIASSEEIVNKLQNLLVSAEKSDPFHKYPPIPAVLQILDSTKVNLIQAIDNDEDIHERLSDIIRSVPSSEGRQLKEMQLYLTLLSNHLGKENNLIPLTSKVAEVANIFLEISSTPWLDHLEKIEKIVKESLSEKSELLEKPSLLNTQGMQLNTKSFAHIHAEAIIKGSHLEGNYSREMMSYLKNYLTTNQEKYSGLENYQTLVKMLEDAEKFSEVGYFAFPIIDENDFKATHEKFHELFHQKISALKAGEITLIETGWVSLEESHSMKLGIERNKNDKFCFTIYNAGSGVNYYHPFFVIKDETLYQPFIKIDDIEEKNLLDKNFTQAFCELQRVNKHPLSNQSTKYNANDVYRLLGKVLGGEPIPCDGNKEKFMPPQSSGICTWASLLAVLFENLSLKDYYKLTLDIRIDSLCAYYQENKLMLSNDEEKRLLLEHSSVFLAQHALTAYENKAISIDRLHEIYATLKELKRSLDQAEWDFHQQKSNINSIDFNNLQPLNKHFFHIKLPKMHLTTNSVNELKIQEQKTFVFDDWINNPQEFTGGADRLLNYISTNPNRKEALLSLETFFIRLAHNKNDNFWNAISFEEAQKLMVIFADLSEFLFEAAALHPERHNSYTTHSIYLYALMVLFNQIHFGINADKNICESYMNRSIDVSTKEFNLYSPEERHLSSESFKILKENELVSRYNSVDLSKFSILINIETENKEYTGYDFDYISTFLNNNFSIKEKLVEDNPLLKEKLVSRELQVAVLASDWYGKYLPPHFCAFRRQNLIAKALLENKILSNQGRIFETIPSSTNLQSKFTIEDISSKLYDFNFPYFFEQFTDAKTDLNSSSVNFSEKDIYLNSFATDFEKNLRLLVLKGDANHIDLHLEQQVIKTLAYFLNHFELLEDFDMRMLCRYLLFESNYLEKILHLNPFFKKLLEGFIVKGIEHFQETNDITGITFFVELGRNLEEIFKFNNIPTELLNFKKKILELLSEKEWNYESKTLLYQQLAASYIDNPDSSFSKEDIKQLLISLLYIKIHPLKKNKATQYLLKQIEKVSSTHSEALKKILLSKDGNEICNEVFSFFTSNIDSKQEWNFSCYPCCTSNNGRNVFDLANLELYIDNVSLQGLPDFFLNSEEFIKIFGNKNYPCRKINNSDHFFSNTSYLFTDQRGNETILTKSGTFGKISQKLKDGTWYNLSNLKEIEFSTSPFGKDKTTDSISSIENLPNDFLEFINNNSIWTPLNPEDSNVLYIRDASLNITHSIVVENDTLKKCYKNPNSENPLELVDLKDVKNTSLSNLLCNAMLWKDGQGNLKELEINSLNLFFTFKKEDNSLRAYCREYPGYFLASNQQYKGLRPVGGGVVLENEKGLRKLVIPYGKISPKQGVLNTQFEVKRIDETKKCSLSLDLNETSKPIITTKEQQLYLANILLAQKKYSEAQKLLRNSFSNIIPYKDVEIFLIKQTIHIILESKDQSPHALALILTASSLLPKNTDLNLKFADRKKIQHQYKKYKDLKAIIPDLLVTNEEESKAALILNLNITNPDNGTFIFSPIFTIENEPEESSFSIINNSYFSNKLKEEEKVVLTRFPRFDFNEMCQIAKEEPLKLELILLGLDNAESVSKDLVSLWRAISHGFIFEQKRYKENEFLEILKNAMSFENNWKAEQQKKNNSSLLMQGVGELPKRYTTTREAQSIAMRASSNVELTADPLFPRPPFLNDAQFIEFFSSIENRGLKLEPTEVEVLQKAVSHGGEQPFHSEATQLSDNIERYWSLDHHNKEWHNLKYSVNEDNLPAIAWMLTPEFGKLCVSIQNNPAQLEEIIQLNKERPFSQDLITLLRAISHGFMKENLEEILNLPQTRSTGTLLRILKEAKKFECDHLHIDFQTSPDKIDKLKTILLVESAELNKLSMIRMQELLAFANQLPPELKDAILFETEKMGKMRQEITLQDLILFTARSRHFTLEGKNPNLIEREKELLNRCLEYLDIKAQYQQLHRAISAIENLESVEIGTQDYHRISETLYKELIRKVPYEAHEFPELLVFEVMEEIGLHEWQVNDLKRMVSPSEGENSNLILEKVMGSGKTKVYLPLLALSNADGDHIPMIVVHSSQYETVAQALHISSGQMFNQVAHTLSFSRDSDTSVKALNKILEELEEVRRQKHFFVVTDKSMHSLGLAFDQLWHTYLESENEDPDLAERIKVMQKILLLIKAKGKATFDEADLLLNCRYEVVYSLGDALPIKPEHANVVADLYEAIDPIIDKMGVFTQEGYEEIKPELISAFLLQMKDSNIDLNLVTAYFNDQKEGEQYVDTLPEKTKNALAIAHYEFAELLPIVLEKRSGEHYGYSDDPNKIFPVPCLASGVPSKTSEFSFPYALLDYTMQTLKHQGVSPYLLKNIIKNLQFRAKKERKANPILGLQNTQAYKDFLELCGSELSLPLLEITDREIVKIVENYKKNPQLIYNFAKKYLLTAATLHSKKITSTPYTLQKMFSQVQGFTGTPWNSKTYPNDLITSRDPLSAGKTQGIIWKNSQTVHSLKSDDFIDEIAPILKQGNHHAFIDVGALFNGVENQNVAENLLKVLPEKFKGILFYKDNLPYVLERDKSTLIPYEKYESTQSLFIFYDQWHTTGTDYKIGGKSLLSVGKNTKMRDLEQGYMRDRQAELGERVEFLIPPETQKFLQITLNLESDLKISTAHLLRGAEIVQERELKDQLLMATFGKINQVVHGHLRDLEFSDPVNLKENREVILNLIVDTIYDSPWEQFGRLKKDIPTEQFFSEVIKSTLEKLKPLMNENLTKETLEKELWSCVDLTSLPEVMSDASKSSPEKLVEKESQTQLQQERMALVQKEVISDREYSNQVGPIHWSWDPKASPSKRSFYRLLDNRSLSKESKPQLGKLNEKSLPLFKSQPPIFKASTILETDRTYKNYADVFDFDLSYNFFPKLEKPRPFSKGLIDVKNMLICRDRESGEAQLILISAADEGYFYEKLAEDRGVDNEREVDVALYNMTLGIIQSNSEEILNGSDIIIDDQVKRKIVQAKFYNGESLYSEEERVTLEEWINSKGIERMKTLFIDHILVHKSEKRKEFQGSILEEIFSV